MLIRCADCEKDFEVRISAEQVAMIDAGQDIGDVAPEIGKESRPLVEIGLCFGCLCAQFDEEVIP